MMVAGVHVPDYPPMESPPVNWQVLKGVSVDQLEEELGNIQVPFSSTRKGGD